MKCRAAIFCMLLTLSRCAGRTETMRYTPQILPPWIVQEWSNAQEELLRLPGITQDPRRYSPYEWEWVQLDKVFSFTTGEGRAELRGLTQYRTKQIIICCGFRETVRHEAFHAILWSMGDPRYEQHYPEIKDYLEHR